MTRNHYKNDKIAKNVTWALRPIKSALKSPQVKKTQIQILK